MSEDLKLAKEALERARQRLGVVQGKAQPPYSEARDARGSSPQASQIAARTSLDSLGSILKRWESNLPTIGQALQATEASSSTGQQPGATGAVVRLRDRRPSARTSSTRSCPPLERLTNEQILMLLLEMDALTNHRSETSEEKRLRMSVYRERLVNFPADAVVKAITGWPDCHDWWPTWAELKREIEEWL